MLKLGVLAAAGLALCLAVTAGAQAPPAPAIFPFVLPWDDAAPGTATDVSFLNVRPAGADGFIETKNGHFVESGTGRRIRFLGTNFAAASAFPSHADAEKVAARLAKLGINIVRMHHMDNNWGPAGSIWDWSYQDRQHINPAHLDKLDYLVAQFKKNGIYTNLNLHVSREFSEADGFPPSVTQLGYAKRVDNFDPRMIALQKNYARNLLTHVNPYTKLSYAEDPCVAVVEINNENSLVGDPWAAAGADLDALPEPFRGELVGLWNDWLLKKYAANDHLKAAWLQGVTPPGPPINGQAAWSLEHQGTSQADSTLIPGGLQIAISQVDGTDWHVQAHQTGLDFQNGATYTVSFRAKADTARKIGVGASLDEADWHNVGLSASAALTPDWKDFRFVFDARDTVPDHGRIAFTLGGQTGTVNIAELQVAPGAEGAGLQPGQSLAKKNIGIPVSGMRAQKTDWLLFLADTERAYADNMRDYLRNDLHVHANIIDTQISWGGLSGLGRNAVMDFADNHAYWQHPSFPHVAWDSKDWTIGNTSQIADLAAGGGSALRDLAEYRVAGKPYTVSEYNEPAPNDFQAEAVPLMATFAAFQDWDAFYLFDYGSYGAAEKNNDAIQGYFAISSNPAKTAFLPAAAMIFRAAEFPAAVVTDNLPVSPETFPADLTAQNAWRKQNGGKDPDFLTKKLALRSASGSRDMAKKPASTLSVAKNDAGGIYTANAPEAKSVIGYVGGQTVRLGTAQFAFPTFGNNFAAVTLTAMDRQPLARSKRALLTLVGKVENEGMVWNAAHNSVGDQWGHGPTRAEGVPATVTMPCDGPRHVYALDGTGKPRQTLPTRYTDGTLRFTVGPADKTVWYEISQ